MLIHHLALSSLFFAPLVAGHTQVVGARGIESGCERITFYACTYHSASEQSSNGGFYIRDVNTNPGLSNQVVSSDVFLKFDSDTGIPWDEVINAANPDFEQHVGSMDGKCNTSNLATKSCRQASTSLAVGSYRIQPAFTTDVEMPCQQVAFGAQQSSYFTVKGGGPQQVDTTPPKNLVCPALISGEDNSGCFLKDVTDLPVFADCGAITLTQSGPVVAGGTVTVSAVDAAGNGPVGCTMTVTGKGCGPPPTPNPTKRPTPQPTPRPTPAPSPAPSLAPSSSPSYESISHKLCDKFAVHARTTITFAGVTTGPGATSIHGGDIGVSPGTSITGAAVFDGGRIENDKIALDLFAQSVLEQHAEAMAEEGTLMEIEMGGVTFYPGTYYSGSAINFAHGTVVTLDGLNEDNPVFLFRAGTTLITAADTYFILKNGAKAENVRWVLGSAATLGANSILEGSILAGTAITVGIEATVHGCALAIAAVTFEGRGHVNRDHYIDSIRYLRG